MKETLARRQTAVFPLPDKLAFKARLMEWARSFEHLCVFDNNHHLGSPSSVDFLLAAGAQSTLSCALHEPDAWGRLNRYREQCPDWLFGFLTYDLKNELEDLQSNNPDDLDFSLLHFFQARYIFKIEGDILTIDACEEDPHALLTRIQNTPLPRLEAPFAPGIQIQSRFSKAEYLETVARIREHIIEGDLYEMNFCQEFFAEDCSIDPLDTFIRFNELTQAPFAAYFRKGEHYLLCASPERFLKKEGSRLISQPIKGTIARGADAQEDEHLKEALRHSTKDQAENVMIVDLVRNDLARSCRPGTVKVEELFGIYSFAQVHQMISTVTGVLTVGSKWY